MKKLLIASLLLTSSLFGAPDVPQDAILKPTFMTGFDSFSGGTAFLCEVEQLDIELILTAHHLFGPACGWKEEFKWNELRPMFEAMTGLSMNNFRKYVTSTELLTIPDAKGLDDNGYDHDIAAWKIPEGTTLPRLKTAKKMPEVGDTVYLFARERNQEKLELFEAKVTVSTRTEFEFLYKRPSIILGGTSGAPVLNEDGNVVGINIGGGESEGKTIGIANPLTAMIPMLRKAIEYQDLPNP